MVRTATRFSTLVPITAITAMAKMMFGMAKNTSQARMMILSATPPIYPATIPSTDPTSTCRKTAAAAIKSDAVPPVKSLVSTSRPSWSVPRMWPDQPSTNPTGDSSRSLMDDFSAS